MKILITVLYLLLIVSVGLILKWCCCSKKDKVQYAQKWDKTFEKSKKVQHKKVIYKNIYGINIIADMYMLKK